MDVSGDINILSSLALKYHNSGVKHPEDNWADLLKVTYHNPDICRLLIDYLLSVRLMRQMMEKNLN